MSNDNRSSKRSIECLDHVEPKRICLGSCDNRVSKPNIITSPSYLNNIMRDNNIRKLYPSDNITKNIDPKLTCLGYDINKVSNHDKITTLNKIVNIKCEQSNNIQMNNLHFNQSIQMNLQIHTIKTILS